MLPKINRLFHLCIKAEDTGSMCGIAGYVNKGGIKGLDAHLANAAECLNKRGPDFRQIQQVSSTVALAHARLSIIDTSDIAHQPMADITGRYTIIFNGEIFNYRELADKYLADVTFKSTSDTEVLLYLYIKLGKDCLQLLNGFFALAIHDKHTNETLLARDRYGIKPLHIYSDSNLVIFASELKAIMAFPIAKQINYDTLALYLQLNYIPDNQSMLQGVSRLTPGSYATISSTGQLATNTYYTIPYTPGQSVSSPQNYDEAKHTLRQLVEAAVERRLVSDVPLGSFLSGGIDSSIITYCAAKQVRNLNTFSIGFKDEVFFDETKYANLVAKKFGTNHTVFSVSNDEMFDNIYNVLDYIDEPFADSSAIAVFLLSKKTRQKVTVALSGDGGDELFAGYNKHKAEMMMRNNGVLNALLKPAAPLLSALPQSRHSKFANLFRKVHRYAEGASLSAPERYWRWCVIQPQQQALTYFSQPGKVNIEAVNRRRAAITANVKPHGDINDILYADMQMVLPGDMLTKVDLMSMANSLEVRVPLLDYTVVNYAFSLPAAYKIDGTGGKKILKDAFRNELPQELFTRPKHGFEVPLRKWLMGGLNDLIESDLLKKDYIVEQGIFDVNRTEALKKQLYSSNPGDAHAVMWALVVFQYWYKKFIA